MPNWHAINTTDHLHAGWKKIENYAFAKQDPINPVLMTELAEVLAYFPLGFAKSTDGIFQLVAIQSLNSDLNLFVNEQGQWLVPYVPASYLSYPFKIIPNAEKNNELTLCFDAESGLVHDKAFPDDLPLLTPEGELSEEFKNVVDFMKQYEANSQATQELVSQLVEQQVVQPWEINLQPVEGAQLPQAVEGLYRIDEPTLRNLAPDVLSALAQSGALGIAYAQLLSQARLKDFNERYRQYFNQQKADGLHGNDNKIFVDDDMIKFN